nr:MAG TPA: hypothetical protein [Caudoviricetes sp.]
MLGQNLLLFQCTAFAFILVNSLYLCPKRL